MRKQIILVFFSAIMCYSGFTQKNYYFFSLNWDLVNASHECGYYRDTKYFLIDSVPNEIENIPPYNEFRTNYIKQIGATRVYPPQYNDFNNFGRHCCNNKTGTYSKIDIEKLKKRWGQQIIIKTSKYLFKIVIMSVILGDYCICKNSYLHFTTADNDETIVFIKTIQKVNRLSQNDLSKLRLLFEKLLLFDNKK